MTFAVHHFGLHPLYTKQWLRYLLSSRKTNYIDSLDQVCPARYREKLSVIDGLNPYSFYSDAVVRAVDTSPWITYPVIVICLLFNPGPLTMENMRAFEIVEAYNQFVRLGQGLRILVAK